MPCSLFVLPITVDDVHLPPPLLETDSARNGSISCYQYPAVSQLFLRQIPVRRPARLRRIRIFSLCVQPEMWDMLSFAKGGYTGCLISGSPESGGPITSDMDIGLFRQPVKGDSRLLRRYAPRNDGMKMSFLPPSRNPGARVWL